VHTAAAVHIAASEHTARAPYCIYCCCCSRGRSSTALPTPSSVLRCPLAVSARPKTTTRPMSGIVWCGRGRVALGLRRARVAPQATARVQCGTALRGWEHACRVGAASTASSSTALGGRHAVEPSSPCMHPNTNPGGVGAAQPSPDSIVY
jgi:hypothetical protein